jgi:hypothetical protein
MLEGPSSFSNRLSQLRRDRAYGKTTGSAGWKRGLLVLVEPRGFQPAVNSQIQHARYCVSRLLGDPLFGVDPHQNRAEVVTDSMDVDSTRHDEDPVEQPKDREVSVDDPRPPRHDVAHPTDVPGVIEPHHRKPWTEARDKVPSAGDRNDGNAVFIMILAPFLLAPDQIPAGSPGCRESVLRAPINSTAASAVQVARFKQLAAERRAIEVMPTEDSVHLGLRVLDPRLELLLQPSEDNVALLPLGRNPYQPLPVEKGVQDLLLPIRPLRHHATLPAA